MTTTFITVKCNDDEISLRHTTPLRGVIIQDPDFDDMSSFVACEIDDAIQYIYLRYGAQAPITVTLQSIFTSFCVVFKF